LKFSRGASPDGPFDTLDIGVAPRDSDGVTLQAAALDMDADSNSSNERKWLGQTKARFGRLWLGNAYGSDQRDLTVPFEVQYWNGNAFIKNLLDNVTSFTDANIGLRLNGLNSSITPGTFTASGGIGSFVLTKPTGATLAGSVDIVVNLGATGSPSDCASISAGSSTAKPWLASRWCGTGYDRNPTARATFGIADQRRGHIYLRESY
jgi:MSHA biogenesis protein MshQ